MPQDPMKKLMVKSLPGRPGHRISRNRRFRGRHLFILLLVCLAVFFAYKKYNKQLISPPERPPLTATETPQAEPAALGPNAATQKPDNPEKFEIRHQVIRSSDTVESILDQFEFPRELVVEWERACKPAPLAGVHEGDELIFFLELPERQLSKIFYSGLNGAAYALRKTPEGWECQSQAPSLKMPVRTVTCRYAENFHDSCIAGGLPSSLVANLADIFAYDIDFSSDLKDGDSFTVFFQEQEIEGKEGRQYLILAAEAVVSGKAFQAVGFVIPDEGWEYFDLKGNSLKRSFLKSPLSCRRMLSLSSYRNVKPVLKMYRPRLGIDYAAPKGTPVSSVSDGVVTALFAKGKSSVLIEIRHRGGFKSVYGNLSGYSRGLKKGAIVSQGEVIGSVGSGSSGQQYLDFHFYKNGRPANFQSIDFPRSISVPKPVRAEFEKTRDSYIAALQGRTEQKLEMPSGRD